MGIGISAYEGSARSFSSGSSFRGLGGRRILASHEKRKVIHYGPSGYAKWGDVERAGTKVLIASLQRSQPAGLAGEGHGTLVGLPGSMSLSRLGTRRPQR